MLKVTQELKVTMRKAPDGLGLFSWCHIPDIFQTISYVKIDNYKLNNLVRIFNLSKELLQ